MMDGPQKGSNLSPAETEQATAPVDTKDATALGPIGASISDASKNRLLKAMVPEMTVNRGNNAKPCRFAQRGNNFQHPLNSHKPVTDVDLGAD